jgi:leucyl-tRNA synthetase
VFVDGEPKALPDSSLPVELPDLAEFKPSGSPQGPLAAATDWVHTRDPETGRPALRETNTMPQWAGSCWYYLRYLDPSNGLRPVDPEAERYWMPVDLYVGGSEHAVLHLLYARFWHKVLHDAGVVSTPEPFGKLVHQGMILGELELTMYVDEEGKAVSAEHVRAAVDLRTGMPVKAVRIDESRAVKQGESFVLKDNAHIRIDTRAFKMSKSRGNVVNPDEIIAAHGADAFRLYEMFLGPLEQVKPWSTRGVEGTHRFLNRAWRLLIDADTRKLNRAVQRTEPTDVQWRLVHATIAKITEDIEALRFNTAIAALMEFTNAANKWPVVPHRIAELFTLLLSPFAPHIAEELWQSLGHADSLAFEPWPRADEKFLVKTTLQIPVQVDGKIRGRIEIAADAAEAEVLQRAREDDHVAKHLLGRPVQRAVYVPGRIVNFVLGN